VDGLRGCEEWLISNKNPLIFLEGFSPGEGEQSKPQSFLLPLAHKGGSRYLLRREQISSNGKHLYATSAS